MILYNISLTFGKPSDLTYHFHGGSKPLVESGAIFGRFGDHDRSVITRTSTEGDWSNSGATPTNHSTSYPGGGASSLKSNDGGRDSIVWPAPSANNRKTRANEQTNRGYARDLDSFTTADVPPVALEGFLRPPKTP